MGGRGEEVVVIRMLDFVALGSSSGGQQLGEVRGRPGWASLGRNAAGTWPAMRVSKEKWSGVTSCTGLN
jgi:hypothetical protein